MSQHMFWQHSSCIDFIFTSYSNLTVNSGVHPSLHPNCDHQIVYEKSNLEFHFPHLTNEKYSIMDKGTLNLLEQQFINLIGRKHLVT